MCDIMWEIAFWIVWGGWSVGLGAWGMSLLLKFIWWIQDGTATGTSEDKVPQ